MIIGNMDGQYLTGDLAYGEDLKNALEEHHIGGLPTGLIMVAKFNDRVEYFFEVGMYIKTTSLKSATFMYPCPGSVIPVMSILPRGVTKVMITSKTCLFRDCRLPTLKEYNEYLVAKTI